MMILLNTEEYTFSVWQNPMQLYSSGSTQVWEKLSKQETFGSQIIYSSLLDNKKMIIDIFNYNAAAREEYKDFE